MVVPATVPAGARGDEASAQEPPRRSECSWLPFGGKMIKPTPEALKRLAVYLKKGTAESSAVERLRVQLKDGRLPDAGDVAEAIEDWDALVALLLRSTRDQTRGDDA